MVNRLRLFEREVQLSKNGGSHTWNGPPQRRECQLLIVTLHQLRWHRSEVTHEPSSTLIGPVDEYNWAAGEAAASEFPGRTLPPLIDLIPEIARVYPFHPQAVL
jgi:hypothetical protein